MSADNIFTFLNNKKNFYIGTKILDGLAASALLKLRSKYTHTNEITRDVLYDHIEQYLGISHRLALKLGIDIWRIIKSWGTMENVPTELFLHLRFNAKLIIGDCVDAQDLLRRLGLSGISEDLAIGGLFGINTGFEEVRQLYGGSIIFQAK